MRVAIGLVPRRGWLRWPPVPSAASGWVAFRMETAYGSDEARPDPADVLAFLEWCKEMRRLA